MKSLKECVAAALTTPMNTMGMGGITAPTDTTPGSGDIPMGISKPSKQNLKDYIKKKKKFKRYNIKGVL